MGWYRLQVTLTLQGPVLSRASSPGGYGIDAAMVRTSAGLPYLPGSLVKGCFRQAWEELDDVSPDQAREARILLGKETGSPEPRSEEMAVLPKRASIRFSDFVHQEAVHNGSRQRIRIDSQRGAVVKGALQTIETPFASGSPACFSGSIDFPSASGEEARRIQALVQTGLGWITSLGAEKGVGFGRLLRVAVSEAAPCALADQAEAHLRVEFGGEATEAGFILTPEAAFCIAKPRVARNLFESEESISGKVIKGCIAATWALRLNRDPSMPIGMAWDPQRPTLGKHFEVLRFTHGQPTAEDDPRRPVTHPLSLVTSPGGTVYDVALLTGPALVGQPLAAPAFSVDWKSA
ncbi:MAG: RAMP superfamily CRISPR-associated protein, partial [Acidobacteriota bacterium]